MTAYRIKSSHWIVDEKNRIVMGEGRLAILDRIESTGSINQAAKSLRMSYKTAWSKIKSTEGHLKIKIVETDRNKGTRLTRDGKALLEKYRGLKKECVAADDRIFKRIFEP
ncbi:MAG: LysR family transcriptional regulator [Deltaproteobacteria bacterium]|nr:LysR family transcriptional regulator [Deltaproteobacteria bacterium]